MPSGQYFSEINGNPAIIYHGPDYTDRSLEVSSIQVTGKDNVDHIIGNFTVDELKKIAESIR